VGGVLNVRVGLWCEVAERCALWVKVCSVWSLDRGAARGGVMRIAVWALLTSPRFLCAGLPGDIRLGRPCD
ncbi:hypothetical protein, partial [Pseudomonas syringae group genomosp. 7]|uniref:hypothetical protein n=1 Tax=Pseudomonas syringae group genomosp. 7 TaxID=251699 RepID=UPI00376FEB32